MDFYALCQLYTRGQVYGINVRNVVQYRVHREWAAPCSSEQLTREKRRNVSHVDHGDPVIVYNIQIPLRGVPCTKFESGRTARLDFAKRRDRYKVCTVLYIAVVRVKRTNKYSICCAY